MATVIKVDNLSKAYQLGYFGTGTLSNDLKRSWAKLRGKEDPFLTVGELNDRSTKGESDIVWSLKDLNFEIEQGDAVGIIGRNGAGKSTLLKILSRITSPTTGSVKIKGRVSSLLEVGTGFHGELSGRENIYLNGAILGMRKKEIDRRFDEIVAFSGVERYIDTPVKRYSSGMYVRLAFAVAAHLESEILIVDEVLAVGDVEFQKKCLGKMNDVAHGQGRTVLFVSHNMLAVQKLCTKGLLLSQGLICENGAIEAICNAYLSSDNKDIRRSFIENSAEPIGDESVKLLGLKLIDTDLNDIDDIYVTTHFGVLVEYEIIKEGYYPDLSFLISSVNDEKIFHSIQETNNYEKGKHQWVAWIPANLLNDMEYLFTIGITTANPLKIHLQHTITFEVFEDPESVTRNNRYIGKIHGTVRPAINWKKM